MFWGELLWGVLQKKYKTDDLLPVAFLECVWSKLLSLHSPLVKALGPYFPVPKAHGHQAAVGLHPFEMCSQRGVNGLELLRFQHCLGWSFKRQRGENGLLPGVDATALHLFDSKKASLYRASALECRLNTQCAPLSLCSSKMCKQFDKAECRLNSLHTAGFSHAKSSQFLARNRGLRLLPGCHCRKTHAVLPLTCKFCKL